MDVELGAATVLAGVAVSILQAAATQFGWVTKYHRLIATGLALAAGAATVAIGGETAGAENGGEEFFTMALTALGASQAFYALLLNKWTAAP